MTINDDHSPALEPRVYRGLTLDPFQAQAIGALEAGHSVLVCAPTGTGKTVVADWMVEKVLARGQQVVYTAPIKALSNQKFRDYCRIFGEDRVGLVTGDLVIRRDAPCRVMTTEILRNMLLVGDDLPALGAVIIDEIHFLDDRERGTTWEEVLIYLPKSVQVVGLSATLSNLHDFADWLEHVRGSRVEVVEEYRRAVPLGFRVATAEGGLRTPEDMSRFYKSWVRKNAHALKKAEVENKGRRRGRGERIRVGQMTRHSQVFRMLWPDDAPYMYFVFSRRDAEGMARALSQKLPESLLTEAEHDQVVERLTTFAATPGAETALEQSLGDMYLTGVAFHHAGLHVMLKALVEELYEKRLVKVLYCTSTFALGINMPARTAVFDGLMRFDGREIIPLPSREFMQMAGRAGRRGMDEEGLVVVRTNMEEWEELEPRLKVYLQGKVEPVRSRFSLSFNSVVNLLERHPADRIRAIVEMSFLAFHRRRQAERDQKQAEDRLAELQAEPHGERSPKEREKELRRLRDSLNRAGSTADRTWDELQEKVAFLKNYAYIAEDGSFNAGARVLRHIQISEIFVTELFLDGILDELDANTLFGVLCGICASLPRGATTNAGKTTRGLGKRIDLIRFSEIVVGAEELTKVQVTWDADMIAFGCWWAEGRSLGELMMNVQSTTDISGDLVGAFRRAKDLAQQLKGPWAEDRARVSMLDGLIRKVTRDEVEVVD